MGNPFIKYIDREKRENVFHSSAYGVTQSGGNIGVASTESFAERQKIEKNRKIIRGYNDAKIVSQARAQSGIKAEIYMPPSDEVGGGDGGARISAGMNRLDPQIKRFEPRVAKTLGNQGKK